MCALTAPSIVRYIYGIFCRGNVWPCWQIFLISFGHWTAPVFCVFINYSRRSQTCDMREYYSSMHTQCWIAGVGDELHTQNLFTNTGEYHISLSQMMERGVNLYRLYCWIKSNGIFIMMHDHSSRLKMVLFKVMCYDYDTLYNITFTFTIAQLLNNFDARLRIWVLELWIKIKTAFCK